MQENCPHGSEGGEGLALPDPYLYPRIRELGYQVREVRFVDRQGRSARAPLAEE